MPLHGKIVVIKRSGGDGTEFPLTATCLFGRKPDCDIRIQLPQVSKEHCRIDLNENKEVILTNMSSVNPTQINGEILQQSERLKHGDVITIIDRSFRFEYPPAPTPKKRASTGGKNKTLKVLQNPQVVDTVTTEPGDKRGSEVFTDGTNNDNIQRSQENTVDVESKEDGSLLQNKTTSPFNDLYQMIKKSLDVKTPRKSSSVSLLQTPTSRFCTPKPGSVKENDKPVIFTEAKNTPLKEEVLSGSDETKREAGSVGNGTPKSVKKQRRSFQLSTENPGPAVEEAGTKSEVISPQRRIHATPQKFSVHEVIEQVCVKTPPKSPMRRKSKEVTPAKPAVTTEQETAAPSTLQARRVSPRNLAKAEKVKEMPRKRKSGELGADLPSSRMKKKRVSFGVVLSPELFDKRLPPDSPLRKGANPRRSLCLQKPTQSLLRRASVIGLREEFEPSDLNVKSPAKKRNPSPKNSPNNKNASPKTPISGKKSPKSRSPSPKAASPGKKSPKSKSPSPKAATPGNKSPISKTPLKREKSPSNKTKTPTSTALTPTVQGRFSVSRISTPSPVAEDAVSDQVPLVTVTPKIPLRRKSMKSATRKTPSVAKSAVKVIRRSGISRASMKFKNSWADIVKFGRIKAQVAAPAKKTAVRKTTKKAPPKLQTPARKLQGHVSTGHANSPVTIVVGKAHKRRALQPTGAAPKVVINTALLKKNMKMDEDLTGISDMFKTPVNERKRKSVVDSSATETPVGVGTSVVEPSVLNTPEEPGEMIVSPLTVASTMKSRRYNSEAVQRLLNEDQESSVVGEMPDLETQPESSEQQSTVVNTTTVTTPKQKPEQPACLTGVKRIMKTPRQKAEPLEDLRGKILKTPKQKPEQKECLTGVKRIMKTPRQKNEPVEDIRGNLLVTPKQKLEKQECFSGVKRIFSTPQKEAEAVEDLTGELADTSKASKAGDVSLIGSEMENAMNQDVKNLPMECRSDVKSVIKTPKQKSAPVEDMVGVKRLMKTPKQKAEPVEDNFGIRRLMKSPRLRGNAPVEDFEGLQELMEEPQLDPSGQNEKNELTEDQVTPVCDVMVKEVKDPQDDAPEATDDTSPVSLEKEADEAVPSADDGDSSTAMETISHPATDDSSSVDPPKVDAVVENVSNQPEVEITTVEVTEMDSAAVEPVQETKSTRGRRAKTVESEIAENKQDAAEQPEELVAPAPVRGRRGKKTEATAPPTVRQIRKRNVKTTEEKNTDVTLEESGPQPSKVAVTQKRGRNAKKASEAETVAEATSETVVEAEAESKQTSIVDVNLTVNDDAAPEDKPVSKPKRGRQAKQPEAAAVSVPEKQEDPCAHSEGVSQADTNEIAPEVSTDLQEAMPTKTDENKPSADVKQTVPQEPAMESLPEVNADVTQKKSLRGRRTKLPESKQEATDHSEEPAVTAPVRGRRGKKTEPIAPPAVRQTRIKNAKAKESPSDDKPEIATETSVEPQPLAEKSSDAALISNNQEEHESPVDKAAVKPTRGRKTKPTPVETSQPEMEKTEVVSDDPIMADPPQPVPIAVRPTRGRKTVKQNEVTAVTEETKQVSQPPLRARRGRNAKLEEEKKEISSSTISDETPTTQEPAKKLRKSRKAEKDNEDLKGEELQSADMVIPLEAEAPSVPEPQEMSEQVSVTVKPKRGRQAKQCTESDATEDKEVPAVKSTEKPKRGRRGKETAEADVVPVEASSENLPEAQEKNTEPDAPVIKTTRGRGTKTSVKSEDSQVVPAKRARRGAAPSVEDPEPTVQDSSVPTTVEPVKRGRLAASAKSTSDEKQVSSDKAGPSEGLNGEAVEDAKMTKRSVRWKSNLEIFPIPKVTPVKSVRGRKSKHVDQGEAESKNKEKNLSDEVVEAQPIKRARRGAKVADESLSTTEPKKGAEAETQLKTRRGRSAKQ